MKLPMDNQTPNSKKPKQYNNFLRFSGVAIQMVVIIYFGNFLGEYLDERYHSTSELYTKLITLAAVFLAIFVVIRQVIAASSDK